MQKNRIVRYRDQILENSSIEEKDFRILYLEVRGNSYLGELKIDFTDLNDQPKDGPYSTIIIGPNGTGKSNILRAIIQIFRELNELIKTGKRANEIGGHFQLIYSIGRAIYRVGNIAGTSSEHYEITGKIYNRVIFESFEGSDKTDSWHQLEQPSEYHLPKSIVASSIMLTDKFPVLNDSDFLNYKYQGVRRSPNIAGTRTYIRRTVDHIIDRIDDPKFVNNVIEILDFLELEKSLVIQYHPKYRGYLFNPDKRLTIESFHQFFDKERTHKNRKTDLWGKSYYEKIKDDDEKVRDIIDFCFRLSNGLIKSGPRSKSIQFDLIKSRNLKADYTLLKDLSLLDFISYPTLLLSKEEENYSLTESSSGEYHLLATMIGIIATIREGGIVLIDEPEISLHPNWQMKYMEYIRQIFKEYKSVHFLIATHSHFIISDLTDENSAIVALNRDEGIKSWTIKTNTFGWSAEQVLFDVFKVPTTRNHFVSERIAEILDEIAKGNEKNEAMIKLLVKELIDKNIDQLSVRDPFKEIIDKLIEKYG